MNELQVKTIEAVPAKVIFNHEEIEKDLEKNLKKYQGLTFTEDDAVACNKTIVELRKGKKAVDEYRKEMKKRLTQPVAEFEEKCKALNKKFDEVINPLKEQSESFEERRREEKRQKVEEIIAKVIEEYDLVKKYACQLVVSNSHLTKSKTEKSIKEEFEQHAQTLKLQQEKEESEKEIIKNTVTIANERYEVDLSENPYLRLLEYKELKEIKNQILDDAQKEVEKRLRQKKLEEEKAQREAEQERAKQQVIQEASKKTEESIVNADPFATVEKTTTQGDRFKLDPFAESEKDPFEEQKETVTFKITGTFDQINKLKAFMDNQGIYYDTNGGFFE